VFDIWKLGNSKIKQKGNRIKKKRRKE
jgi:hypothetical protein